MKNEMVVKSNTLIEASYRLSTQEQKVILSLAAKIKNQDEDFKNYTFSVKEFANITGARIDSKYHEVKTLTSRLLRRVFTINEVDGPLQLSWLSAAKYFDGEGLITLRFDPGLKPYLLQLKDCFTKFSLSMALRLKSSFSIRMYELLKQYEAIGSRSFLLADLKTALGISDNQYKLYGHFKAKVLKVAQEELAEKTDITFEYEEIKVGRGVGKIAFIIKTQVVPARSVEPEPETSSKPDALEFTSLLELLPEPFQHKVSIRKVVKAAFNQHGFDYVMRNILYTNEKSNAVKTGANITKGSNYRVYLSKALQADYGLAYQEDQESKNEIACKQREAVVAKEKQKKQEMDIISRERDNREKARTIFQSYPAEKQQLCEEQARLRMTADGLARYKRKDPIGNIEFKRRLEDIIIENENIQTTGSESLAQT